MQNSDVTGSNKKDKAHDLSKIPAWKSSIQSISASIQTSIQQAPPPLRKGAFYLLAGAVTVLVSASGYKIVGNTLEARAREAEMKAGPRVRIATVKKSPSHRTISVIGETRSFAEVTLYAKVSGYLRKVNVDKGDKVKKNQILATIESPETDKEYKGALADSRNKTSIAKRMEALRARSLISAQEAEQASSDAEMSEARLEALAVQKEYETLRAPFDGTITSRFADAGALVQNAANSQTSALPVVTISQVDRVRIYAYLDQRDATYVQVGDPVKITLPEKPGIEIESKVARMSGQLDPRTRMLLTEVNIDNQTNQFVTGSFVQVSLQINTPSLLSVPIEALVNRNDKSVVPVVKKDNTINYREVRVAGNDGQFVTLIDGLEEGEQVALNLGNSIPDGSPVRPIQQ